jgi:hypothetical protein
MHSGDLAKESVGVRGDEELSSGIEIPVLELGERDLTDLKPYLCHFVGLSLDVGLLQPKLRPAFLDLLPDTRVLLVDAGRVILQLFDQRFRFCDRDGCWAAAGEPAGKTNNTVNATEVSPSITARVLRTIDVKRLASNARGVTRAVKFTVPRHLRFSPTPARSSRQRCLRPPQAQAQLKAVMDVPTERSMTLRSPSSAPDTLGHD